MVPLLLVASARMALGHGPMDMVASLVVVGLGFLLLGWYDDRQHAPLNPIGDPPGKCHLEIAMAQTTKAGTCEVLPAVVDADDDRWSVPQAAMLVTVASTGLWTVILLAVRWVLG
jgi:hypothetical protein